MNKDMIKLPNRIFQRYTSKENTVTDNTMRLFKLLDERNYLNKLLYQLQISNDNLDKQIYLQVKETDSVPDAELIQPGYKIIIEFKLNDNFYEEQLINHLNGFNNYKGERKILLTIGSGKLKSEIKNKVEMICNQREVKLVDTTYDEIIKALYLTVEGKELEDIAHDYESYCIDNDLLYFNDNTLIVFPVNNSYDICKKYSLYYCPEERKHKKFGYIGLYKDKSVNNIGKFQKIPITVNIEDGIIKTISTDNEESIRRIKSAFNELKEIDSYLKGNVNFYLLDDMCETKFEKRSSGGLLGSKKFQLDELIGKSFKEMTTDEIANELRGNVW